MSNRLTHLKATARSAHKAVLCYKAVAAIQALKAGAALSEAKSLVKHGGWAAWLDESGIPERTAQRYMALLRGGLKSAIVADLGISRAAELASLGARLWPKAEQILHVEGIDEDHHAEALWHLIDQGRTEYTVRHAIGKEPAIVLRYPAVSMPWLLGLFHADFPCLGAEIRALSPEDAVSVTERINAGD